MSDLIAKIKSGWNQFDLESLEQLEPLYSPSVTFIEPAGEIRGREAVFNHFRESCTNLIECRFGFDQELEAVGENQAYLVWTMAFRHRKLNKGEQITTNGISLLKYADQINFHRDWFDLGQTVYEHLPLIGAAIRFVKGRMQPASLS